jgi:hypothetical protein
MAMQRATLGAVVAISVIGLVVSVLGALMATQTFNNTATIRAAGVGVYSDGSCTSKVSSLSWGTLAPGESKTQTLYVKNEGSVSIVLSKSVGNWTPSGASSYITLTWNYNGSTLSAGNSIPVVFNLTVSQTISGITSFSFDITITGTEHA